MEWLQSHNGLVFGIIAMVVVFAVFADMIPIVRRIGPSIISVWRKLRKKPVRMAFEVPQEVMDRLEELRKDCEKLSGKPMTLDDLFANAIDTYHHIVKEHQAGTTFLQFDEHGHPTELVFFERKPA
ncbi:MAG: hypothetical protein Q7R71_00295 [bacterium]|nr:hypothetical protein [bacterium]